MACCFSGRSRAAVRFGIHCLFLGGLAVMNAISLLSRLAASACLLLLAACQTPTTNTAQPDTQAGTAAAQQTTTPSQTQEAQAAGQDEEQGIPVAVLLADTVQHE